MYRHDAQTDTEILIASQAEARRILDEALEGAASLLRDANDDAGKLILEQRRRAGDLLLEEQDLALRVAQASEVQATAMSDTVAEKFLDVETRAADLLSERQSQLAADLVASEEAVAQTAGGDAYLEASAILMEAHREAAAVLLEARMLVEQRRVR